MSKEIVHSWLMVIGIIIYVIIFLIYLYDGLRNGSTQEDNSLGCAIMMILIPAVAGAIWWYVQLPDTLKR